MSKPKLVYFRIRGRAEPIRLMLQDIGVEYDEEHPESWAAIKKDMYESGEAPFSQIPLFITGDPAIGTLVQMNAILRYLGRKYDKYGRTEAERCKVDMILDGTEDWRMLYAKMIYADGCTDAAVAAFGAAVKTPLQRGGGQVDQFERILSRSSGAYFVSDEPTIADYCLYDLVCNVLRVVPDALGDAPLLSAWVDLMGRRPNIAAYIASNPAHRINLNGNGKGNGTA